MGGLGAVLAITPPQLGTTSAINIAGGPVTGPGATSSASASSSSSATASATTKATATKSAKPVATKSSGTNQVAPAATADATTAPATTAPATNSKTSVNGTFTGPSVFVNYGNVQVKITVVNGHITDAVAVKAPSGKNDRWTNMAVPVLKA